METLSLIIKKQKAGAGKLFPKTGYLGSSQKPWRS
jgi:hypothetical protein